MGRPKKGGGNNPTDDDDDPAWSYCSRVNPNSHLKVRCNLCEKEMCGGVFRMKHHLARTKQNIKACTHVGDDVANLFKKLLEDNKHDKEKKKDNMYDIGRSSDYDFQYNDEVIEVAQDQRKNKGPMDGFVVKGKNPKQSTLNHIWKKGDRDSVVLAICRFFYANALPFNVVESPFFAPMMEAVASFGPGLKLPSYHEVRHTFLQKEVQLIEKSLDQHRKKWSQYGCTLMMDGWTDGKNRSITNFLVNSPCGTVFIKSVDTSSISRNAQNMFELIDSVVEEIGEEHVVQVVTDSAAALVKAGELLMEKRKKLFWSPCSAHLLDLMLKDIGKLPTHATTIAKARKISVFIYTHTWVLNLMRKYTKGRGLIRAAITRFATNFLTLKSIHDQRVELRSMFASKEWEESSYSTQVDGVSVRDIILADQDFWPSIKYFIKCVAPLVKVLRLVYSDKRPLMGYIYEAIDWAKEAIAKNCDNLKEQYDPIWRIIDSRWNLQLHCPLHAAAYFLNPAFQYDKKFNADLKVKKGLYDTLERFVQDRRTRILVDEQIDHFKRKIDMFGRETAQLTIKTKQPALWWESFGDHCPELQKLALRILSLTCSSSGCERNWSMFEQIHSKRRNILEQKRLNSLVFVKYNLNLQVRQKKRERDQALDPICLSDMDSDDEWITEKEDPALDNDISWMDLGECFTDLANEGTTSRQDKLRGPTKLAFGRKDKEKRKVSELDEKEALVSSSESEEEEVQCLDDGSSSFGDDDVGDDDVDVDIGGDVDSQILRMRLNNRNMVVGKDALSSAVGDVVQSIGSPMQAASPVLAHGSTNMLIKKTAQLHQQQHNRSQQQQLQQHALSSQQSWSSNHHLHQQEKMGLGSVTVGGSISNSFRANDLASKNQGGRKRKQPVSSSGPANSSGTANTAGCSPSSALSTPSTCTPGDVISMPSLQHSSSSTKPLIMFGSDGTGALTSPSNQLAVMDQLVEDGGFELFFSHYDADRQDTVGRSKDVSKGFTFNEVGSVQASGSEVFCCHFSSDGKLLASGGFDGKVVLWHTDSLKVKTTLEEHSSWITDVRFSPSLPRLATSSVDKSVKVWEADNPKFSLCTFVGHGAGVLSLDFHPYKGDLICSCDGNNELRYWNISNGTCTRLSKISNRLFGTSQMRFQPRLGRYLAAVVGNAVSILDVETQACLHSLQGDTKPVHSVCWDPSGEYVASVSEDSVRVWSLGSGSEGECVHELSCNGNKFHSCVFHPTSPSLLVIGCNRSLELWNMSENKTMTLSAHDGLICALAVSNATGTVASAGLDEFVKLWK